ncbi:MAG TPA: hypothetical protein EYN06_10185 [Myxococcales bacterium]|nr:hypothetical protein [Myxococcales bacterium]
MRLKDCVSVGCGVLFIALLVGCGGGSGNSSDSKVTTDGADTPTDDVVQEVAAYDEVNDPGDIDESSDLPTDEDVALDVDDPPDTAPPEDVEPPTPVEHCEGLMLDKTPMNTDGPFGYYRHDLADDFKFYLLDGDPWVLSEHWTGCDVYVFITNTRSNSQLDPSSIWNRDVDTLLAMSPKNVHFFFMATRSVSSAVSDLKAMQGRVDEALAGLSPEDADYWLSRVHVGGAHFSKFTGWLKTIFTGAAHAYGFAIDRHQQIRLLGSFADVTRYKEELKAKEMWPWEANMGYAAHDVRQYNFEYLRNKKLAAEEGVTIVSPWSGEVLKHWVTTETEFPSAEEIAKFDTLEIDLTMDCPDPKKGEFGNCGAWDYLSHIYLQDSEDPEKWIEVARFITTYHREGRYLVDATPILAFLKDGGKRTLKYDISPQWNQQAYLTQMDFRFSNRNKGYRLTQAIELWKGASFNKAYNDNFETKTVDIPATAKHVALFAIITGHGMDTQNCAEFCNHQHFFTVNSKTYTKKHPAVGQQEGCISEIENGMVPNQGGTWWFGRGGWCPGQQVEPFVADVTAEVAAGESATLSYEGKLNGSTPPDNAGNIRMSSLLVIYE